MLNQRVSYVVLLRLSKEALSLGPFPEEHRIDFERQNRDDSNHLYEQPLVALFV